MVHWCGAAAASACVCVAKGCSMRAAVCSVLRAHVRCFRLSGCCPVLGHPSSGSHDQACGFNPFAQQRVVTVALVDTLCGTCGTTQYADDLIQVGRTLPCQHQKDQDYTCSHTSRNRVLGYFMLSPVQPHSPVPSKVCLQAAPLNLSQQPHRLVPSKVILKATA